jgi:hypothetical protein
MLLTTRRHRLLYAAPMNPAIINALISAGAGVVGAIVGAGSTLVTANLQHRRTIDAERKRETQAREKLAAEKCGSLITQLAKLVGQDARHGEDDEAWSEHGNKKMRLDEEIQVEALYLPVEVRRQVDLARLALTLNLRGFYLDPHTTANHVALTTNEILSAFVRNDEPLPERSEVMIHLAAALDEQEDRDREEYAEELSRSSDAKYQWLVNHPEVVHLEPDASGRDLASRP